MKPAPLTRALRLVAQLGWRFARLLASRPRHSYPWLHLEDGMRPVRVQRPRRGR